MIRGLMLTFAATAFAQDASKSPAFDVASVRASQSGGARERGREIVTPSPDGVIMRNVSLKTVTAWAYHVLGYQVNGPDWTGSDRYDITAKAAGALPDEQLRAMMQTLLAERFKMAAHRQTKEMQAYLLGVAKGGPKFKESASEGESDIKPDQKTMTVTVQRTGMPFLIDALSNIFRAPVIDQTGLTGKYDITINLAKYLLDIRPGDNSGPPPDPQAIVLRGLQEELGLKLEAKKMPVDLVIIDRAEKVPVEN
jgi:uncharacterized protein (TIGR03435 family)